MLRKDTKTSTVSTPSRRTVAISIFPLSGSAPYASSGKMPKSVAQFRDGLSSWLYARDAGRAEGTTTRFAKNSITRVELRNTTVLPESGTELGPPIT
jgi:hypothetical protein